jgi:hypothetical protein
MSIKKAADRLTRNQVLRSLSGRQQENFGSKPDLIWTSEVLFTSSIRMMSNSQNIRKALAVNSEALEIDESAWKRADFQKW